MCGICGMFDTKNKHRIERAVVENMTDKLFHRGPDAAGYYIKDNIAFGFTRLSIIDLEGGMQPLCSEDNSIALICNGEIYNHLELRKDLISKGHKFKTNCDVEVILHLYEDNGTDFINELNGQFAFAIFDSRENKLFCARDHAGIAPFFYTMADGIFIFASEIKAIIEHPSVGREVDLIGLDQIMSFPGMASPRTLFKNINSLEGGHYLLVDNNYLFKNKEYWDLNYYKINEIDYIKDENYYIEKLDELITRAVKYRLQADVPVGFYISGGLDSSIIALKIGQLDRNERRHSFSIDFTDKDISESKYQKIVSSRVNSIHHEKIFQFSDISKRLRKAVRHSESALKETYNTASLALSEQVREENMKVVLTGEGADELFGGYVGYKFDSLRQQQKKQITPQLLLEDEVRKEIWGDEDFLYEKDYYSYRRVKQEIYSSDINMIYDKIDCLNYPIVNKERLHNVDIFCKRSYVDFKLRMSDHLLSDHGDRMAYANSVEARYPFLDKDFIEFSRFIPTALKLKGFDEKYILKKVAEKNNVPKEIIMRPKFAFVAPGSPALLKQDIDFITDMLSYDRIKRQGYFNPDTIEKLKKRYTQPGFKLNVPYDNDLLIIVITFGIFLEEFNMSNFSQ